MTETIVQPYATPPTAEDTFFVHSLALVQLKKGTGFREATKEDVALLARHALREENSNPLPILSHFAPAYMTMSEEYRVVILFQRPADDESSATGDWEIYHLLFLGE